MSCPSEEEMYEAYLEMVVRPMREEQSIEDYEERLEAYGELGDALIFYGLEGVEIVTEDEYRDGK